MHAEIRHLEAFLAVARLGSFTRAASALHVSQPALTVQIRQLEAALAVRLFDRNNRRVALTRAGQQFVAPVERLLLDLESIVAHARDLSAHRRGSVSVAALPSVASGLLPRAIHHLNERHHGIVVRVRDVVAARVVERVPSGEVDVGVSSLVRPDDTLVADPLFVDRLCALARPDHPAARRSWLTIRELSEHALVLTGPDSSVRQIVDRAFEHARLAIRVSQEATYMTTAMGMAKAGLGLAVLPESALDSANDMGLRAIAIRRPTLTRQISVLRRADRSLSAAAEKLVEILRGSRR